MAGVPQKTLNWLYDVLKREYHDPNRTYSDLAQTLAQYPGFAPRTDVYTSENGAPALLLNFKGTLPVNFRGTLYRFPIALWIPHAYPYEAPIIYVSPTDDMVVRPGQHVSASDGKIYHHYLASWKESWDRSNVVEFLRILADVFSKEPPVMAKPQQIPSQQLPQQGGPPPVPPPPPAQDSRRYSSQPPLPGPPGRTASSAQTGPPLPPPKQAANVPRPGSAGPSSPIPRPGRYDAPPPLPHEAKPAPPLPSQTAYGNGGPQQPPASGLQYLPQRASSLRQQYHHDQSPSPQQYRPQSPSRLLPEQRPPPPPQQPLGYARNISSPPAASQNYNPTQPPPPMDPAPHPTGPEQSPPGTWIKTQDGPRFMPRPAQQQYQQPQQYQPQSNHPQSNSKLPAPQHMQSHPQLPHQQQQQSSKPPQPKDLLSDNDPFQVSLPTTSSTSKQSLPAPPIPTNPEKTALLSHLSHLLIQSLHTQIYQTQNTALPSLHSQHAALTSASHTLTQELQQLQNLSSQLQSNISAMQSTITNANTTIQSTQDPKHASHPDNMPAIDQIIIPPTVVARQLYDAVAEQRGYEAAIFALNEAFVRGRIGAEVWGRKVRECAREEMRRKWLVRKIGEGLGLEDG